jgi:hypothetical protein
VDGELIEDKKDSNIQTSLTLISFLHDNKHGQLLFNLQWAAVEGRQRGYTK